MHFVWWALEPFIFSSGTLPQVAWRRRSFGLPLARQSWRRRDPKMLRLCTFLWWFQLLTMHDASWCTTFYICLRFIHLDDLWWPQCDVTGMMVGKGNHSKWPHFSAVLGFVRSTKYSHVKPQKKGSKRSWCSQLALSRNKEDEEDP